MQRLEWTFRGLLLSIPVLRDLSRGLFFQTCLERTIVVGRDFAAIDREARAFEGRAACSRHARLGRLLLGVHRCRTHPHRSLA